MADEWNATKPIDHTKIGDLPSEHRKITAKVKTVLQKEHRALGDGNSGGEHKKGSAQAYSDDYSGGLPQLRPDGATAIDANDEGRLAVDTNDGRLMAHDGGSAGDDTDYLQVGGEVLDEDDMSSDSDTKLATQQSIKAAIATALTSGFTPTSMAGGTVSVTLPNGLTVKWGSTAIAATGGTISFPVAFDNACLCVIACSGVDSDGTSDMGVSTHDYLAASFDYSCYIANRVSPLRWFAIGY